MSKLTPGRNHNEAQLVNIEETVKNNLSMSKRKPKSITSFRETVLVIQIIERTNMHYVTLSIDHYIAIMAVLDLQNVAGNRVRSHGLYKV